MSQNRKSHFKSTGSNVSRVDRAMKEKSIQNRIKREVGVLAKRYRSDECSLSSLGSSVSAAGIVFNLKVGASSS